MRPSLFHDNRSRWGPILRAVVELLVLGLVSAECAAQSLAAPVSPSRTAPDYPATEVRYDAIDASELSPLSAATQYSAIQNGQLRYLTNVAGQGFMAPLHLPAGARMTYLSLSGFDNTFEGEIQASLGICDPLGQSCTFPAGNPPCTDSPVTVCSGILHQPGFGSADTDLTGADITIDNVGHRYFLFAGNTTNDGLTAISEITLGFTLQVSPAPPSATFTDVPTTDAAFQFIEAVAAAGITAGCGGGNYCPDQPITRRQMAVFLAKALGLQWN